MGGAVLTVGVSSSTGVVAVAAGTGDEVVEGVEVTDRQHAERLVPLLTRVLADAGRELAQVERLAVDVGPGLFTGLRVGLATVGGLARALDVPVVTASSLLLLVAGSGLQGEVLAVIDARRGEVFRQRFVVEGRQVAPLDAAALAAPTALALTAGCPAVGDGAVRYRRELEAAGAVVVAAHPSAAELVRRADDLVPSPSRVPRPCYLREPDARIGAWSTRAS